MAETVNREGKNHDLCLQECKKKIALSLDSVPASRQKVEGRPCQRKRLSKNYVRKQAIKILINAFFDRLLQSSKRCCLIY